MVASGRADAYAGDKIKLVGLAIQAKEPVRLALLADELSFEPYAMALPRHDLALRIGDRVQVTNAGIGLLRG